MGNLKPIYLTAMGLGQSDTIVETSVGKLHWRIDGCTSQQFLRGTYEPYMQDAFRKYISPGSTVFDIGAHVGFHSMYCGLLVGPAGRVVAFEPNPISRKSLEQQICVNSNLRVEVVSYALSDAVGFADFDATQGYESRLTPMGKLRVEMRTLDSLVPADLPVPNVIKIDVEGEEENVLRGSVKTLSKYRPIVLCDYNDNQTLTSVSRILFPLGYEVLSGPPVIGTPR